MSYRRRRRTIFGGNSGYQGYSKSNRAVEAEERGLRNKSQMDREFLDEVNAILEEEGAKKVTLSEIKRELNNIDADEWHHTSMYGNRTNYYSPETIADYFSLDNQEVRELWNQRERQKKERKEEFNSLVENFKQDFPEYEIKFIDDIDSSIIIKNPEDNNGYSFKLDKSQTKKELRNIIKSKFNEINKRNKRENELSDYLKKIGAGLNVSVWEDSIFLSRGKAWDYTIKIDEKTTNSEIKKEIKRILEPYLKEIKKFEDLIKKYKFIKEFHYSPYTGLFWIEFVTNFKEGNFTKKGITNDYREWQYKVLAQDISFDELKKELDSFKKEFKYL